MQNAEKVETHDNDAVIKGDNHPVKEVDDAEEENMLPVVAMDNLLGYMRKPLLAGKQHKIQSCATSIIAQNPSPFTGRRNARNFTYLTQQDVTQTRPLFCQRLEHRRPPFSLLPDYIPNVPLLVRRFPGTGK